MNAPVAWSQIREMAFTLKFIDVGKVILTTSILRYCPPKTVKKNWKF
jgi:hypothetical protein